MRVSHYKIITCADRNFFHFLPALERNVLQVTGEYPIIYDLGMTQKQRSRLRSQIVSITPPDGYNESVAGGAIRTNHRVGCIRDCLERFSQGVLYIDADVLMIEALPVGVFEDVDIALTPRHPNEMRADAPFRNGRINAGVMYFAAQARVFQLLDDWEALCALGFLTDQQAMSDLMEDADLAGTLGRVQVQGLSVLKLDPRVYDDVGSTTGRLWHFKNAGRRFHKKRRWLKAVWLGRWFGSWQARRTADLRSKLPDFRVNSDY